VVFAIEHHTGNEKDPEQLVNNAPGPGHYLGNGRQVKACLLLRAQYSIILTDLKDRCSTPIRQKSPVENLPDRSISLSNQWDLSSGFDRKKLNDVP